MHLRHHPNQQEYFYLASFNAQIEILLAVKQKSHLISRVKNGICTRNCYPFVKFTFDSLRSTDVAL